MAYVPTKVLIFGKTYPELSSKYVETVCTGGLVESGRPIRLYPVPLRYLDGDNQYSLYDWITVPIEKSSKDPRPESFHILPDKIQIGDNVPSDKDEWSARRDLVFRDKSWHFGGMSDLMEANRTRNCSIGFVQPGQIDDVIMNAKPASERTKFDEKMAALQQLVESDMFHPSFKRLAFMSHEITLRWRCADRCKTCANQPHAMKVLDWGLFELARRDSWGAALNRMREISDLSRYDFRLYLGNFRLHMRNFGIIGLWYPKKQAQGSLFRPAD
jgi:hypothetical protein